MTPCLLDSYAQPVVPIVATVFVAPNHGRPVVLLAASRADPDLVPLLVHVGAHGLLQDHAAAVVVVVIVVIVIVYHHRRCAPGLSPPLGARGGRRRR